MSERVEMTAPTGAGTALVPAHLVERYVTNGWKTAKTSGALSPEVPDEKRKTVKRSPRKRS